MKCHNKNSICENTLRVANNELDTAVPLRFKEVVKEHALTAPFLCSSQHEHIMCNAARNALKAKAKQCLMTDTELQTVRLLIVAHRLG